MKTLQIGLSALALAAVVAAAAPASAHVDMAINTATYTYQSWDAAGNSIANNIGVLAGDGVTNNDVSFWTATATFNLADTNQTLSITDLASDDRVVVFLNGTAVASAGIFGPGNGTMIFTPGGPQVAWSFNDNGAQNISVNAPFLLGDNTLELIVNNTNAGINGGFTQGPSSLFLTASVDAVGGGVPEPATWAMMLAGFGGLGAVMRRRRAALAAA